jgi:transposase
MARRARIILAAAGGLENKVICAEVGADANTVSKWRRRFAAHRLDGLLDEPRPGTPRTIGDDAIAETIRLTLEATPAGATHWSLRSMAKAVGHAPSTIHRIWRAANGRSEKDLMQEALIRLIDERRHWDKKKITLLL